MKMRDLINLMETNDNLSPIERAEVAVRDAEETYDDAKHAYRDPGPMDDEDELNDAANAAFDRLEDAKERLAKLKEQ